MVGSIPSFNALQEFSGLRSYFLEIPRREIRKIRYARRAVEIKSKNILIMAAIFLNESSFARQYGRPPQFD